MFDAFLASAPVSLLLSASASANFMKNRIQVKSRTLLGDRQLTNLNLLILVEISLMQNRANEIISIVYAMLIAPQSK